ncbi:family 78 glycoside hydrolase catalytic domain [Cohnella rhizosphaerae]|uniref:Family 78 glycoside hydrolase catalytic domain n=1 Tax=Cohnella rhizosphaerae TaxID=1457232 RepID=A0A9X4QUY1_9BACL|nr:family 78 glycoside hydrolase catalytic domain [Cohnella rhizosphaerae]MDG0812726.1 family 78 glycoside hydrolase catalytic domain [Cohnella rhizosphaerae]
MTAKLSKKKIFAGKSLRFFLDLNLEPGDHLFVMDVSGMEHGRGFHIGLDGDAPLDWASPLAAGTGADSAFVSIGPFHTVKFIDHEPGEELNLKGEEYLQVRRNMNSGTLAASMEWVAPIPVSLVAQDDVFASCIWKREARPVTVPATLQLLVAPNGAPAEIPRFKDADTEIVIDFGRELSGYIEFELTAEEGTVVDCYGFEYMRAGWRQDTHSLDNTLRYTCRAGRQSYSSLIRRGMRYLMLTIRHPSASVKPVRLFGISVIQSHYPVADIGRFRCSDALLNEVWKMSAYTTKLCMEDTFVDCPAYEQTFWVGDSRNEALIGYYTFGAEALVKRCLELVPGSSVQTPLYADQLPGGLSSVIPNWTFLWIIACQEYFEQTGDATFAARIWPHVRFTLRHYVLRIDALGLLNMRGWNFLDWAPIDQPDDGIVTHQNVFLRKAMLAASRLAMAAGCLAEAEEWTRRSSELRKAINRHLWTEENNAYADCIHADGRMSNTYSMQTQVSAYLCEMPDSDRAAAVEGSLMQPPVGFVPIGSPFMSFFYYEAMDKIGQHRWIVDDIRHHYGNMLEHDATTCWEMYPAQEAADAKPAAPTRSHCHAWSAAPAYFLGAIVLGVRRTAPGWKEAVIAPQPCGLSWASGAVPVFGGGRIDVSWRIDEAADRIHIRVSAPASLRYEIRYPAGYEGSCERIEVTDYATECME